MLRCTAKHAGTTRPDIDVGVVHLQDDLLKDLEKEWNQSAVAGKGMGDVLNFLGEVSFLCVCIDRYVTPMPSRSTVVICYGHTHAHTHLPGQPLFGPQQRHRR
jgi:hypothetical protein